MSSPPLYICLLLAAASSSCAALDSERNLAPLYSEHWTAGGGVGVEALGGSVLTHRPSFDAELDSWAIRPLFIHEWKEDLSRTEFLYPFGTVTRTDDEFTWNFAPIARYSRTKSPEKLNLKDRYTLLVLPLGLYFSQFPNGRRVRAAFPFLGVTDDFLTFDKIEFVLFPLYLRTVREGRTTWHWLFPFFSYSRTGHASLKTGTRSPFALADGDNIDLVGPAGAFSVSLKQSDFSKINHEALITQANASHLAAILNANPDMQANGLRAEVVSDYLLIQTEGIGPTQTFQVAGGSALPSLGWTAGTTVKGDNSEAWRAWPLVGHNKRDGRYDRWYFLWPLFQFQKNDQRLSPEKEELSWMVFPLIGRTEQGTFESTTILWPFIGYSKNPAKGFYSLDLPWPLVNIQEPGTSGRARRYRFWPIYSIYEGDGMVARSWAWPFIQHRVENYRDGVRTTFSVLPFYQSSLRSYVGEEEPTQWQRLWPLWQHEEGPNHVRSALPALNPLWHTPKLDRHYAWLWEAYSNDSKGKQSHQRGWLGLWRHEADEYEIRTSLGGLWGRRTYRSDGALTHDNSLLFGLFRWRSTEGEGADLLSPALPGPGWPLRPSTELLEPPTTGPAPLAP